MQSVMKLIASELQQVELSEAEVLRAAAVVGPNNEKVRLAADQHLRFEDEPAAYERFLREAAERA